MNNTIIQSGTCLYNISHNTQNHVTNSNTLIYIYIKFIFQKFINCEKVIILKSGVKILNRKLLVNTFDEFLDQSH